MIPVEFRVQSKKHEIRTKLKARFLTKSAPPAWGWPAYQRHQLCDRSRKKTFTYHGRERIRSEVDLAERGVVRTLGGGGFSDRGADVSKDGRIEATIEGDVRAEVGLGTDPVVLLRLIGVQLIKTRH